MSEIKEYYCIYCRDFTKQSSIYQKNYKDIDYISSYQCTVCNSRNYDSGYDCPKCGAECNEYTWIKSSEPRYCNATAIMYGGAPYEWEETHKCWNCDTVYEFTNSNY